jgi:hypothetical protein
VHGLPSDTGAWMPDISATCADTGSARRVAEGIGGQFEGGRWKRRHGRQRHDCTRVEPWGRRERTLRMGFAITGHAGGRRRCRTNHSQCLQEQTNWHRFLPGSDRGGWDPRKSISCDSAPRDGLRWLPLPGVALPR